MFKKVDCQMEAIAWVAIALLLVGCAQPQVENKPSTPQVEAPQTVSPRPASQQRQTPRRLKLRLTLDRPEDLKVMVNEIVDKGQLLSERSTVRASLLQQRNATMKQLQQLQGQKIAPSYAVEKGEVAQAQFKVEQAKTAISNFYSDSPWTDYARRVLALPDHSQLRTLEVEYREAQGALVIAVAKLQEVQQQRLLTTDVSARQANLLGKIREIEKQMNSLGVVRSPYSGVIKATKWLGQVDREIQVELTLNIESGANETPENRQVSCGYEAAKLGSS